MNQQVPPELVQKVVTAVCEYLKPAAEELQQYIQSCNAAKNSGIEGWFKVKAVVALQGDGVRVDAIRGGSKGGVDLKVRMGNATFDIELKGATTQDDLGLICSAANTRNADFALCLLRMTDGAMERLRSGRTRAKHRCQILGVAALAHGFKVLAVAPV